MRFGPLGMDGGERRLNVLITRAKRQCRVFSSITSDEIDLERAGGRGVAALKTFLSYAQKGILKIPTRSGLPADSPFELSVHRAVESLGYTADLQVGQSGFFIDIGVRDPDLPGRYLLGIECDGATYHSSRSARDRDRLRQACLEDHGWVLHRIWSLDWFHNRETQTRRLASTLEKARSGRKPSAAAEPNPQSAVDVAIRREAPAKTGETASDPGSVPYEEAHPDVPRNKDLERFPASGMAKVLGEILRVEAPIRREELCLKVRDLWRKPRLSRAIEDAVDEGLQHLRSRDKVAEVEGFLEVHPMRIRVRNREAVSLDELRRIEAIPPAEIREAIRILLESNHGVARDELASPVARMFGFTQAGSVTKAAILGQLETLVAAGAVTETSGLMKWVGDNLQPD